MDKYFRNLQKTTTSYLVTLSKLASTPTLPRQKVTK